MLIPKLQASMAKYEASEMMKKYPRNGDDVQLKSFIVRDSTQVNDQDKISKIQKR